MSFWQWSRGWRCSIIATGIKYSSGDDYQTARRCSGFSRQLSFWTVPFHVAVHHLHTQPNPSLHCNITSRSHALTSEQILCVALRFFANGSFLYNVGDAEQLSKATVCRAVRKVCLALKRLLPIFVVFPGQKPVRVIKEEFHRIAGEWCRDPNEFEIIFHWWHCAATSDWDWLF